MVVGLSKRTLGDRRPKLDVDLRARGGSRFAARDKVQSQSLELPPVHPFNRAGSLTELVPKHELSLTRMDRPHSFSRMGIPPEFITGRAGPSSLLGWVSTRVQKMRIKGVRGAPP